MCTHTHTHAIYFFLTKFKIAISFHYFIVELRPPSSPTNRIVKTSQPAGAANAAGAANPASKDNLGVKFIDLDIFPDFSHSEAELINLSLVENN